MFGLCKRRKQKRKALEEKALELEKQKAELEVKELTKEELEALATEQKETLFQEKMENRKKINEMKRSALKIEKFVEDYIAKTKEAYESGNTAEYKVLRSKLKIAYSNKEIILMMVAHYETMYHFDEMNEVVKDFMKTADSIGSSLKPVNDDIDLKATEKKFYDAINKNANEAEDLNNFLNTANASLEALEDIGDLKIDQELDKLIFGKSKTSNEDYDLDEELDKIKKELSMWGDNNDSR